MMNTIRNLIYTICIVSVIGEIIRYLLPQKNFNSALKFLFSLITVVTLLISLNVLKNTEFSDFKDISLSNSDIENAEILSLDQQIDALKQEIELATKQKLNEYDLAYKELNVVIINENTEITSVECELFLSDEYKDKSELIHKISDEIGILVKPYYIGE